MSRICPFAGYRPPAQLVAEVASPPYDVVDADQVRAILEQHPRSFMQVVRSEVEPTGELPGDDPRVFERAKANLDALIAQGALVRDPAPRLYVYEQTMGEHVQVGLVSGVSVKEYLDGLIKRHEHTKPAPLAQRTRHISVTGANTGLVFLMYRERQAIDMRIDAVRDRSPAYDFVAGDGVRHRLWVVDDAGEISAFQQLFAEVPALYVADGHHRTAASAAAGKERKANNPAHSGDEPYNHFLAVLFPARQLQILAYNRVVLDLNGRSVDEIKRAVGDKFEISPAEHPQPEGATRFGMYLGGSWYRLAAKPGSYPADDPVESLDAAILQTNVLGPILGIDDPRTNPRIEFVGGIRGAAELERRADKSGGIAFFLHPVSAAQVMAVADAGGVMPAKSTWFEPKLRSGLVVRTIDA